MSWLARSIANSLRIDEDEEENDVAPNEAKFDPSPTYCHQISPDDDEHQQTPSTPPDLENDEPQTRGVKEDLNELTQTLSRQLWGVASFLVPPPDSNAHLIESGPLDRDDEDDHVNPAIGVSDMDGDRDRIAYGSEEEEEEDVELYAVGITDEVLAFATNIAHHPETWLDFPMDEEEDLDDFDMSDAQKDHVFAIQHFAPRLAALRIELCPCHMSENYFWKVYFVLLHSRLNKQDAEILSTPQVIKARAMWMQELQKQTSHETDWHGSSTWFMRDGTDGLQEEFCHTPTYNFMSPRIIEPSEPTSTSAGITYYEEKHPIRSTEEEVQFVDKSVIEEKPAKEDKNTSVGTSSKPKIPDYEDVEDDWSDAYSELGGYDDATIYVGNEDDITFSDLEDYTLSPDKPKKNI